MQLSLWEPEPDRAPHGLLPTQGLPGVEQRHCEKAPAGPQEARQCIRRGRARSWCPLLLRGR
jgi:hypothetical protein